jgi:glycosyltransferase involved in cell wall biosynthesis
MMAEKLLSICIPTFNRARSLDLLMGNIATEIAGIEGKVEVCVSDNHSPDGTRGVLESWKARLPLVFSSNDENIGYDRNVLKVTNLASGRFVWLMGDDDLVMEGAVKRVVDGIEANIGQGMGTIYINAKAGRRWVTQLNLKDFVVIAKNGLPPLHVGFIGCLCMERALMERVIRERIAVKNGRLAKKNFNGKVVLHGFCHTYLFAECLLGSERVGIVPDCGISIAMDGENLTYAKKMMLSLLIFRYFLELRLYYPWLRESYPFASHMNSILSLAAIACERPGFERAYLTAYGVLLEVLRLDGRKAAASALRAFEALRRTTPGRHVIPGVEGFLRGLKYQQFSKEEEKNQDVLVNLEYVIKDSEWLLAETTKVDK